MASALEVALILLGLSFLPPIVYVAIIRNTELIGREPWSQIAKTFLWGAIAAVILSFILYFVVFAGVDYFENRYVVIFQNDAVRNLALLVVIAPIVEELAKGLGVYTARRHISEPEDGIVYGASCGLGFAATENLLYGAAAYIAGGLSLSIATLAFRAISSALLHASASSAMGYGIGKAAVYASATTVPAYYLLAVFMHASFNFVAWMSSEFYMAGQDFTGFAVLILAVVFAIAAVGIMRSLIRGYETPA